MTMPELNFLGASKPYSKDKVPAKKSVEGYILIVTNLHPETSEDNIYDVFEEFAPISRLHLNHDKYTGYAKGYALIEFKDLDDTFNVFTEHKNSKIKVLGRPVEIDYAFVEKPGSGKDDTIDSIEEDKIEDTVRRARAGAASLRERLGENTRDASPTRDAD